MSDYKETAVTGTAWTRFNNVNISNPRNQTPVVRIGEEKIANVGTDEFSQTGPGITFPFDPSYVIHLRNPQTNELIPGATMTGMDVYVALYSMCIQKALERDAAAD